MHMLRGEWSPFLWGSGYQTAADSVIAALFFRVLGPTSLALMLSSLSLHVLATYFVFATLSRRLNPWFSLLLTLPLVVSPSSVHSYALYPPRQLSLTLAVAAFWAIDSATAPTAERGSIRRLALGGALATLAVSADPYPLLLLPLSTLYAGLVIVVARTRAKKFAAFSAGLAAGLVPFIVMHRMAGEKSGPMGLSTARVGHHWRLLVNECLPWALSYKVYYARTVMDYGPWDAPWWFRVMGTTGALGLGALVAFAFVSAVPRGLPKSLRRLGFVGALTFPLALTAFLLSVMVMDHFSMRYLAVLTLMTPFAVAPAARALGAGRFALVFVPHLLSSLVGGWVGYGPFVRGPFPVAETPELRDDYTLLALLRTRGLRYATADYWTAYRLTFLFQEEAIVVPTNLREDRYAPYRRAFEAQRVFLFVYDPARSREDVQVAERALRADNERVERLEAGGLTAFVVTRAIEDAQVVAPP